MEKKGKVSLYVLTKNNQEKMNWRKTILIQKELQKQTLKHMGLQLGGERGCRKFQRYVCSSFVGEVCCLISALKADGWPNK